MSTRHSLNTIVAVASLVLMSACAGVPTGPAAGGERGMYEDAKSRAEQPTIADNAFKRTARH
jgi:hypothetical protein